MKSFITSLLPERVLLAYHYVVALVSALYYGFPSRGMVIIGVTGTKGKTSTANFIWSVLHSSGIKAGLISTANIKFHEREMLNSFHMTMPGRFTMQGFLYEMKKTGCTHCVVETTSEGIKQFRNKGIVYDIAVFTNLSPEHLGSHGGDFEQYKKTKGKFVIIGSGGIFSGEDAYRKIKNGASLIQLITGMIYEGPGIVKKINQEIVELLPVPFMVY